MKSPYKSLHSPMYLFIAVILLLTACSPKPEPLVLGKDACTHCKMTIMDKRFGAEFVTTKGKVYKFDDINCMLDYASEQKMESAIALYLVVDFLSNDLVDAEGSSFLNSPTLRTPMGSHLLAANPSKVESLMTDFPDATRLDWSDINKE